MINMDLLHTQCTPCNADTAPLSRSEIDHYLSLLDGWTLIDNRRIEKSYHFDDFQQALSFTNLVGEIAEIEGHHPEIELGWAHAKVSLTTHSIHALSLNDFIIAAKADDQLARQSQACY